MYLFVFQCVYLCFNVSFVFQCVYLCKIVSQLCVNVSMHKSAFQCQNMQNLAVLTAARSQGMSEVDQA